MNQVNVFDCFCGCSNFETVWHGFEYWKFIRLPQRQPPAFRQKRGGCQSNASLHDAVSQLHRKWKICGGLFRFPQHEAQFQVLYPIESGSPETAHMPRGCLTHGCPNHSTAYSESYDHFLLLKYRLDASNDVVWCFFCCQTFFWDALKIVDQPHHRSGQGSANLSQTCG